MKIGVHTLLLTLSLPLMLHSAEAEFRMERSAETERIVREAVRLALAEFGGMGLKPEELAVTLVDLQDPAQPGKGSYRGGEKVYPASVIKLFYLEAAHRWMEEGKLADTPELRRAMKDMIVLSYNEPTHYIIDLLTGTTGGPELPPEALREWEERRNAVNRYFVSRGYTGINVNQKPWCEGPYGREVAFVRSDRGGRNMLTTDATARLLTEIATGRAVTPERSGEMLELLKRDPFGAGGDADDQNRGFTGPAVPQGARLWSKAGWTSQTRHDATYVELENGKRFVLVTFTVNHASERKIIPFVGRAVIAGLAEGAAGPLRAP